MRFMEECNGKVFNKNNESAATTDLCPTENVAPKCTHLHERVSS
jgi:hypothetical protein